MPDSVFVPQGTSVTDLLKNLVNALLPSAGLPQEHLAEDGRPDLPARHHAGQRRAGRNDGRGQPGGLAHADKVALEQVSAQLAWTLASPRSGPGAPIQSVELETNGQPFIPPKVICNTSQYRSQVQNQATYFCYNPYPSQPASFAFTSNGQLWSRCAAEASVQRGQVGPVLSLVGAAAAATTGRLLSCGAGDVLTRSGAMPGSRP